MKTVTTTLLTEAVFSDDGLKRYLLKKSWDDQKAKLTVVMLAPSDAGGIELDTTTQLVLNNATRLGYGGVAIVNLFATLNDFALKQAEGEDVENMSAIVEAAKDADLIVYAPGVGKAKSKLFQQRQERVLCALRPYEEKLHCLCSVNGGGRLLHPLAPAVRVWALSPFKVAELVAETVEAEPEPVQKKKGKGKLPKVEESK